MGGNFVILVTTWIQRYLQIMCGKLIKLKHNYNLSLSWIKIAAKFWPSEVRITEIG